MIQASLRIRADSSESMLFTHVNSIPRENSSQRTRHVALLRSWTCTLKHKFDGKSDEPFSRDAAKNAFSSVEKCSWKEKRLFYIIKD